MATSRDPEEWARRTEAARGTRERVAAEAAALVANQVFDLLVAGDMMGGRGRVAAALRAVAAAEQRQDPDALRAAWMDVSVAAGATVAGIDFAA